jgi:hypothetical protein
MLTTPRAPLSFVGYQPVLGGGRFSEIVKNRRIRFFENIKESPGFMKEPTSLGQVLSLFHIFF